MSLRRLTLLLAAATPLPLAAAQDAPRRDCVEVYTTAMGTDLRLTLNDRLQLLPGHQSPETDVAVFVNPDRRFQTLLGLGGAITDASADVFAGLSAKKQRELMEAYFDAEKGIGYSLLRTTIHSCDFARASYTYVEEGDETLETFDIAPDRARRIPMIKRAIETAGGELTTMASPWSAPAYMKGRDTMLRGGKLLPRYRDAWARYFARFIQAYEAEGIPIWGVSVQNEPLATQTWESMIYTAEDERDFVRDHLGPTLAAAGLGDRKIVVWDHNRDLVTNRAHTILGDPEAAKYVWGVGFHWYETWAGGEPMHGNVAEVKAAYPDVQVLLTEACVEGFERDRYQHWPNAERYGAAVVGDLNAGAVGWIDWNVLLDETGGPNHVGNFCFAPIHADGGGLVYTPSYYYLGHFSKFIRPGAERVSAVSSQSKLRTTSFRNPDGSLATVVLNLGDDPVAYRFSVGTREAATTIPPRAIQTLLTDLDAPAGWRTDFLDDFTAFDPENWQDQMIWVNNEGQCYVPDGAERTREVSDGTLKLRVVNVGEQRDCANMSKFGDKHPDTEYLAGRICSKNRREFVKGKWTARLRTWGHAQPGMFPAWWILGAQNNEPPVQEADETVPWPTTGSGEIDIFEHHGDSGVNRFTTGAIKDQGNGEGDWWSLRTNIEATLDEWHEYSVEWAGSDLVYRVDGVEVHRNPGQGDAYPEPMFAILNYAKITDAPMTGEWVMEVDWVKHESWDERFSQPDPRTPANLQLAESSRSVSLTWERGPKGERYHVYRASRPGTRGERIAFDLARPRFEDAGPPAGQAAYYTVVAASGCATSPPSETVSTTVPAVLVPARIQAEHFVDMAGAELEACGDAGGGESLGFFDPGDHLEYTIRVDRPGKHHLDLRVASLNGSEGFEVLVDGEVVDTVKVGATGGWQTYTTQRSATFDLKKGEHRLCLRSVGHQWNINWLELKR